MRASIVIPVHGKLGLTEQCLDHLRTELQGREDVEVIVVDDGSLDGTQELLRGEFPRVRVVAHESALGFATSCNDGAAEAQGEYLIFLNNDIAGRSGWLAALVSYADSNPRAGAIGSKLLYSDQTIQHAGIVICSDLLPRHVYRGFRSGHRAVCRSRRFQAVTAACMLARHNTFDEVGGFDSGFINGFEDVDVCLRLSAAGHEVHYCADSVLVHFEAATRGEDSELFRRNAERFLARWGDTVRPDDVATYVEDDLLRIVPGDVYPLQLEVDPLLATADVEGVVGEAFRLLGIRSRQVFELLKENTVLRVRLGEVQLEEARRELQADAATLRPFEG